jgi:hypothetical protein
MTIKYNQWPNNIPNGYKIYQTFPYQDPPKFTQILFLGLKIYHLATLPCSRYAPIKLFMTPVWKKTID